MDETICNGGQCRNTPGSFQVYILVKINNHFIVFLHPFFVQCTCPLGTVLNIKSQACEDVDECVELGKNACLAGQCINTAGSFECECPPGTILDSTGRVCLGNFFFFYFKLTRNYQLKMLLR